MSVTADALDVVGAGTGVFAAVLLLAVALLDDAGAFVVVAGVELLLDAGAFVVVAGVVLFALGALVVVAGVVAFAAAVELPAFGAAVVTAGAGVVAACCSMPDATAMAAARTTRTVVNFMAGVGERKLGGLGGAGLRWGRRVEK